MSLIIRGAGSIVSSSTPVTPPGVPTSISVSGFINGLTNSGELTVSVGAPTDPGDTIVGVHLYAEIPDQSSSSTFVIGTNVIGDGSTPAGSWARYDLGKWAFGQQQPWTVPFVVVPGVNGNVNIPSRLYANPYSVSYEPPLIQANQPSATPNQTFTLTSLESGSPSAGTNITTLTGGDGGVIGIVATPLTPVNVSGKLETPVLVDLTDTPANVKGWVARLVLVVSGLDPTKPANWQVVSGIITQAGPVYAPPGDNITTPHSFAIATPKTITSATIWLQAGLSSNGSYTWNNIVPGITPSFPITYGSTVGTLDATAVLTASINATMAVVSNAFGVAVGGISNTQLAALCVEAANLANSSVTATAIANAAVGNAAIANAAVDNAQIVTATILGASIASATIAGANIATATIVQGNMASASIGTAQIQSLAVTDALIASCSVSKLAAGSASFSGTASFANGANTLTISSSGISMSNGTQQVQVTSSGLTLSSGGGSIGITISTSGVALFTNSSAASTTINGNNLTTGNLTVAAVSLQLSGALGFPGGVATASAGSETLPSNPAGFVVIGVGGSSFKLPYYNL